MFLGLAFGIIIYLLTLSSIIIKISVGIIVFLKKTLKAIIKIIFTPIKLIYNFFDKFIFRPVYLFFIKSKSFLTKRFKNINFKSKNIKKT